MIVAISWGQQNVNVDTRQFLVAFIGEIIMKSCFFLQDNVFVQMLCSIQYRVIKQNADDAFYELQNPKEQIQAYVFDGNFHYPVNSFPIFCAVLVPLPPVFFSMYYNQRHTFLQLSEPMFRK